MSDFGVNLRRLMARHDLTIDQVVELSGLDERTVKALLAQRTKPHARTLHRLATGLHISVDDLFQPSSVLAHRSFDRHTNPIVDEVVHERPDLFDDWTDADFDELYSRFGTGGALTFHGTLAAVDVMNRNRDVHRKVSVLLETVHGGLLAEIVDLLYGKMELVNGSPTD